MEQPADHLPADRSSHASSLRQDHEMAADVAKQLVVRNSCRSGDLTSGSKQDAESDDDVFVDRPMFDGEGKKRAGKGRERLTNLSGHRKVFSLDHKPLQR
jgi:hypothetical protein